MNKGLHDIDELFRSQLEGYQEKPSAALKENLDAALDKKEAEKYKRRFIIWKRMALLLLLLLAGFILFESGLIKTGSRNQTAEAESEKISGSKTTITNQDKSNSAADNNTNANQSPVPDNNVPNGQTSNGINITTTPEVFFIPPNGNISRKDNPLVSVFSLQPDKKDNENNFQVTEPEMFSPVKRVNYGPLTDWLAKNISLLPPPSISKPALPLTSNNNSGKKKNNSFTPHWLLSPFVSYEQVGYKLDSDDPLAVTTIKHREVHEPSFSGGLLIARQFTNHFSLQSGLIYTSTQIGISPQKMYALQLPGGDIAYKFITSSGYAYIKLGIGQPPAVGDSITTSDAKHLLKHVSIPLTAKYKFGKNKLTISPAAGIEANFITSAKVEVGVDLASNREIVTVNKLNGIKSFYWSGTAGAEASYQVNKKISVNIQPVFRFALSPITKENVVETFPRSFGVRAGLTLRF
jgi:hypothetical protein